MSFSRIAILVLLVFMAAVPAYAVNLEQVHVGLKDVVDTVEGNFRPNSSTGLVPLQDVTADFFQSSTITRQNREMRGDGQMFFRTATSRTPIMFRFDYFRPTAEEVVSDGRSLWVYFPERRQVILNDVSFIFDPFNFTPGRSRAVNFLQGLGQISQDFQIHFSAEGRDMDGNYVLELTPLRPMATIAKLFLVVRRDAVLSHSAPGRFPFRQEFAFPILSSTVIDHKGNRTTMEFSNVRANTMLSDGLFVFNVPPDAQVVRSAAELGH